MANRFPLIIDAVSETVRELAAGDNLDLTSSSIYNNGATLLLPSVSGTLATLAGTESLTNKTLVSPSITTSIVTGSASLDVFNTTATTLNAFGASTTLTIGYNSTASSTTNIVTGATGSGNTKTINIGTGSASGSTTDLNLGSANGGTVAIGNNATVGGTLSVTGNTNLTGDLDIAGGDLTSSASTFNLLTSSVTTANIFNSATEVNIGVGVGTTVKIGSLTNNSTLSLRGNGASGTATLTTNVTTGIVNLFSAVTTGTINLATAGASAVNIGGAGSTTTLGGALVVTGNLTVNGTTTTVNSTQLSVDDINIILGDTASPTNATADGGGITLKGTTDKTFNWVDATSAWTSSENLNLLTGKVYQINGTSVLSSTTLGSGVINSSLQTLGTITTGTWQGTIINSTYGGTGVNNGGRTITLNTDNLTLTAQSGGSSVTVPASGTLATLAGSETLTNKTIAAASNTITGLTNANLSGTAGITNANLANSTISGVALGSDLNSLTVSTGLGLDSGTTYNGSAARTITNTDRGSSQNIFKNIAVAGQTTVTAASNNDTFTLVAGPNVAIATDGAAKTITFSAGGGGWLVKTANHTANLGESILANTSGGVFTITLPSSASAGAQITIADGNNWSANPLTIARNGNTIMGSATDLILSYAGTKVDFIYSGSTWMVYGNTPSGDDVLAMGLALGDEF